MMDDEYAWQYIGYVGACISNKEIPIYFEEWMNEIKVRKGEKI